MKKIALTQGKYALVDDADFDYLNQFKWQYHHGYAKRGRYEDGKNVETVFMHRVLNETPQGMDTDHINRNKLDNRRCNLRSCTRAENQYNIKVQPNNKLGLKGVHMKDGKFRAVIGKNYKRIHLGYFDTAIEAHKAYLEAASNEGGVLLVS